MLVVRHEIFPDHYAVRRYQVLHRMWNSIGSQSRSHVAIEYPERPDHGAIVIGEQREADSMRIGKILEDFLGIVTDGRDPYAVFLQHGTRFFQLDQLGAAVLSPLRAAVKHKKQAVGPDEIVERSQNTLLIRKDEIGNALAGFRPRRVIVVGRVDVLDVELIGNRFSSSSPPSKLPHDRSLFKKILGHIVGHRLSP